MDSTSSDRRGNIDGRSSDRRRARGRRREDSAFGATASDVQSADDTFFDPGWLAAGDAPADRRWARPRGPQPAPAQESALARVYRAYAAARAVVGLGLVAVQGVGSLLGGRSSELLALVSIAYAVQAITLWLLPRFGSLSRPRSHLRERRSQWLATIGVDLLAFTCLHLIEAGSVFNFAALMVLPVLMAGVLTSRLIALGTAAGVAIVLLFVTWRGATGAELPAQMLQSGLAGLGLFLINLLAGELASRLSREEVAARGSLELARQQAQLNRLVIEEMADGLLVVDQRLRARAANPAARALLVERGLCSPAPFMLHDRPAWTVLMSAVQQALSEGSWPESGRDVTLRFSEGHERTLRLRVRFMRSPALALVASDGSKQETEGETFVVLLLEDLRTLQARIRQEKLAAMGRVSAGIAHEIRNPLAAISQANALMLEDELAPAQQRLARMVADNVARLKRLVDDVMEVAPGAAPVMVVIDACATVARDTQDWARTAELRLGEGSRLRLELPAQPLGVLFDPEHLRRVLVNLLENAHRHASAAPGAIAVRLLARDENRVELLVLSDGPCIAPDIERFLFEPFFSTRSRGTGLGLYICRELCERYSASVEYQPRPEAISLHNEFVVSMRRATSGDPVPGAAPSLSAWSA